MKIIQQRFEASLIPKRSQLMASDSLSDLCGISALRQKTFTELLVDIAWLLKVPAAESFLHFMSSSRVQRFNCLFSFLINNESTAILEKVLQNLKILMDNMEFNSAINGISDADLGLLLKYMDNAREILQRKLQKDGGSMQCAGNIVQERICDSQSSFQSNLPVPSTSQVRASILSYMASNKMILDHVGLLYMLAIIPTLILILLLKVFVRRL